jgi:hypothetical protein
VRAADEPQPCNTQGPRRRETRLLEGHLGTLSCAPQISTSNIVLAQRGLFSPVAEVNLRSGSGVTVAMVAMHRRESPNGRCGVPWNRQKVLLPLPEILFDFGSDHSLILRILRSGPKSRKFEPSVCWAAVTSNLFAEFQVGVTEICCANGSNFLFGVKRCGSSAKWRWVFCHSGAQ